MTSSSPQLYMTSSNLFTWTSSYNSLPDELFPTVYLTSSYPQLYLTSPYLFTYRQAPTTHSDELSPSTHVAELYSTAYTNEPSPSVYKDEFHSPPSIDDLSHKQDAQLKNQVNTHKSDDEGHRPNLTKLRLHQSHSQGTTLVGAE